jgi:hypothetical protein
MFKPGFSVLFTLVFALGACQNPISTGEDGLTAYGNISDQDASLVFGKEKYSLERGSYLTLKANLVSDLDIGNPLVNYTIEQENTVVSIENTSMNTSDSIILSGKNVGTAVITASLVANPDIKTSVTIEVIKHIPALNKVWQNVNEEENYTLQTYRVSKEDETQVEPSSQIIVSDDAILMEGYQYVPRYKKYYTVPLYSYGNQSTFVLGYGIDANGFAFPITMTSTGLFTENAVIAKTERGFLTKDNFKGYKNESISMNDVGLFYGLQAINPDWLAKSKAKGNEYVISGDENDVESCYVKYLLWGLIDPVGRTVYTSENPEKSDVISVVQDVNLTIKADTISRVSFELEYSDDIYINGNNENYVYYTSMENIGTTDCSSIVGLDDYLSLTSAEYPQLTPELYLFEQGLLSHNYVFQRELYWKTGSSTYSHTPLTIYYTEDYFMAYYSKEFCDIVNSVNGDISLAAYGMGYLKKSDGIYPFVYHPYDSSNRIELGDKLESAGKKELWQIDFNLVKDYKIPNYLTYSNYYQDYSLNALSDSSAVIFKGLPAYHYSHNQLISKEFVSWYLGEELTGDDFYHGVNVQLDSTKSFISSVNFLVAYKEDDAYHILYTPTLTDFGNAQNKNPADSYIQEVIS